MKKILSAVTAVSLLASMATSVLPAITASAADDSDSKIIWNGKNITTSLEAVDDGTYTVDGNTIRIPLSAVESGDVSFTTDVKLDTDVNNVLGTFNFWWVSDNDGITFSNPVGPQTTGNTSFEYNGNTVNSAFAFPSCFGSVVKTRKGYAYSVDSKLTVTFNDKVTAMNCDGAGLISNGDGTATIEYSHPTIKADGYIDKTAGTVVDKQVVTIDPSGEFKYWHYNVVADENKEYVYTKEDVTQTIPNYDPNNVPPAGSEWDDVCDMVVGASSNELKFLGTTSKDYPLIKFTTKIAKGTPEGVYTVDLAKNEMSDHDSHRYTSDSKPLTIIIGDGEAPTTEETTEATTVATTAATTPAATTVATTAASKPVGNGPEFVAANISVKPGVGYGAEDTDDYYPAQFPITVNNDPGMAGIKGIIKVPDGFADVFQLKEVSTSDEDMVPGPYQGSFEYNTKYWSFGIASTGTGNWDKQSNDTAFMYYFIKVTPDEEKIAAAAEKMGIKLESDAEGSYYKFPVTWDTNSPLGVLEAVDTNRQNVNPTFTDGSIKVYVNKKAETTVTKPVGNGPEFVAANISVKAGVGYGAEDTDDYYPAQFPITVNNDPGMAGIKGIIKVPDGFADVFQLKEVSTSDEDMVPGPYQGSFEYNTKYWSFGIASTGTGNWEKQANDTAFMYYFIKVTPDEEKIAAAAEKMGIKLESDAEGSYYKFPVAWDKTSPLGELEAVDTNRQNVNPTFTDGSIKVYVNKKAETTVTKPVGNGPEFVAANISVKAGVGYGAEDTDDYYPAQFPITVNNDPGMAGIKGIIKVPDGFADVFQLKEVSTSDEDMVPGPYQGSFEYNTKYWSFGIASTGTGNWDKQSDGTAFMYYFIKVTPDEDKIAATAEKMGIKLESDAEGSYYKFPVAWDTNSKLGKLEAVDTNRQDVNPTFTDGSIKVYVNKKAESTAATTVAKTTESTKATEATAATDVTKATDATAATDVTKATEATTVTDVTKATEATAATDVTKATEATAATDVTKATEATAATDAEATTVATVATTKGTTTTQAPLEVSPKSTTIEVGESFTINAKAADNPSFKYGSNPTNVVVVDATGKVTGINPGETKVLVYTDDGRSDTVLVKVVPAKAATTAATTKATKASYDPIKVNPSSVVIDQGESKTIEVSGGDGDYSYEVIDPSIAIVSPDGTITGRKPGSTKVIVKDSVGNTATVEVTVNAVTQPATTAATTAATTKATQASYDPINATPKEIIIAQGEKAKINVVGGDGNYTFTPSDDSIVTVAPDGTVTGVKPGDVKVIVKDGVGNTDTVTVKVTALTQATTTQASAVNTDATTAATTPAAVVTTAATTPAAVVTTAANNNPTIDPSSDISSNSTAAYFFSVEKNFNKLTKAIKFVGGTPKTVTYQYDGKTVAGPKDVFVKKKHKYELTVLADGKAAGKVTVYIGVKGDANLDDAVDSKDAVAVLITFANAITGQKKALQSDASLETLATYLADVDTETLDYKKLDAKDAVYMLKYFANEIAGNSQPWNKLCKELADRDY